MKIEDRFPLKPPFYTDKWWVSPHNFEPGVRPTDADRRPPYIHEVTLRDGEQSLGVAFKEDERIRIAVALDEIGIQQIEIGLPLQFQSVFNATKRLMEMGLRAKIVPQARAEMPDIQRTMETGAKAIIIVHTINPYHCAYAFNLGPEALIERLVTSMRFAKSQGLHTIFQASDVWRTPMDFAVEVFGAVARDGKPDAMVLTDTTGVATPAAVEFLTRKVAAVSAGVTLEYHGHNDFGLATATALAAYAGGATGLHASFNGLGERTGNVPTEEIVAAMELLVGVRTGIDLSGLRYVSELVSNIAQTSVRPSKPVVGDGLFQIESHIVSLISSKMEKAMGVQTGMLPFVPTLFGNDQLRYVLGKWSGAISVEYHLERMRIQASKEQIEEMLAIVRDEARLQKASLSDEQFRRIVRKVLGGAALAAQEAAAASGKRLG